MSKKNWIREVLRLNVFCISKYLMYHPFSSIRSPPDSVSIRVLQVHHFTSHYLNFITNERLFLAYQRLHSFFVLPTDPQFRSMSIIRQLFLFYYEFYVTKTNILNLKLLTLYLYFFNLFQQL